jgi:hypothetical protein
VGTYYQDLDRESFNYDLHSIPTIPNTLFRGPKFNPSRPYVACIGAAQTFGRFCARPFPALLSERFSIQFLNLGVGGAGPRLFDSPQYLEWLNRAELVIVQVLSGRSEGNSLFDNSETGGLVGVRVEDNKTMRFEDFLCELLKTGSPDQIRRVVRETRENYVRNSVSLLKHIQRPKVLFWFSNRSPDYQEDLSSTEKILAAFPQLVNRAMMDEIRAYCDVYIECVSASGIPQQLWNADQRIDGTTIEDGKIVNRYYPSPEMHREAADLLDPVCRRFLPAK